VALRVFTGGTLCNSFAESINSSLRHRGVDTKKDIFHLIPAQCPSAGCKKARRIVQNSARQCSSLSFKRRAGTTIRFDQGCRERKCQSTVVDDSKTLVSERVFTSLNNGYQLMKRVEREALVFKGMPCIHIGRVAMDRGLRIPVSCYNTRFYQLLQEQQPIPAPGSLFVEQEPPALRSEELHIVPEEPARPTRTL